MSPVATTLIRTLGRARNVFSTAFVVGGALAAIAALTAFQIVSAEGSRVGISVLWALSASPVLPILAAFLAMDVWSGERQTGRVDILLSTAVRERDLVLGKFLGVFSLVAVTVFASLSLTVLALWLCAPQALSGCTAAGLLSAFLGVLVPSLVWCSVSLMMSAAFRHSAISVGFSVLLTFVLPRGIWAGVLAGAGDTRRLFGEMPFDSYVADVASGLVPMDATASYLIVTVVALFITSKIVASYRLASHGVRALRVSTGFVIALALVLAAFSIKVAFRLDFVVDLPFEGTRSVLSARTRAILSESGGDVSVTCFLSRTDARFREIGRFLRQFRNESNLLGGARFILQFVDPRWDIGSSERLVSRGVAEESLVFERGRRMVVLPLREGFGERACASAVRRLTAVARRQNIYWTVGHGEGRFDDYGLFGMSDIAREFLREGYLNRVLDLATAEQIPGDCALVVVAGARTSFSRSELGRLEAYLREGGRILVLLGSAQEEGIVPLLYSWGIRPNFDSRLTGATLSGSETVVSDFSDHPVSASLKGLRLVFERPLPLEPTGIAKTGAGADRVEFAPLAVVAGKNVAVAVERGSGAGSDLAIRPTRIVAIGDSGFAKNGSLSLRACANRDFLLNCVAYLSGTDVVGAHGDEAGVFMTGMDRSRRLRHLVCSVAVLPFGVFVLMMTVAIRRRNRS